MALLKMSFCETDLPTGSQSPTYKRQVPVINTNMSKIQWDPNQ